MSDHHARIEWKLGESDFGYEAYSRNHVWRFSNGIEIAASAAPAFRGDPACVDPEAAFVASVASCHMLTFLAVASRKRLTIDSYEDDAVGYLEKNEHGKLAMTRVELRPKATFAPGSTIGTEELRKMHQIAHRECFIANSVLTEITVKD